MYNLGEKQPHIKILHSLSQNLHFGDKLCRAEQYLASLNNVVEPKIVL